MRLLSPEDSLTLALSLFLEGEGINPEHSDPHLGKIHIPLHFNFIVNTPVPIKAA